jgi:hypothetical protein
LVCPAEGADFIARGEDAAGGLAAEDEGDDAVGHVLVDTGQGDGLMTSPWKMPGDLGLCE